ncbi:MAG: Rab family GTPase [Candidatus Hermodarchaeota archaeon]
MSHDAFDYLFKVVLVGDAEVGKTSLTTRFAYGTFTDGYISTLGVDFIVKSIPVNNYVVKLQAWDTAGQERYSGVRPIYYRGAKGALLVFDITVRQSFVNVEKWFNQIRKYSGSEVPIVIVGNKLDLADSRTVSTDEVRVYSADRNALYFETSAKTDYAVSDVFKKLAELILSSELSKKPDIE